MRFRDRRDAGRHVAALLSGRAMTRPVVFGLPRGGVPVAYEVALALRAPLEVFVSRKIGAPGHEELGIGAIAEGLDDPVVTSTAAAVGVSRAQLEVLAAREREELQRRVARYRGDRPLPDVGGRDVIVVDDGLATGVTAEAALRAVRRQGPGRLVLAVPVCATETQERLSAIADEVVTVVAADTFFAVGRWYDDFAQTSDAEVVGLLEQARTFARDDDTNAD